MSEDEFTAVREELEGARAEVEQLQVAAADREARAVHLELQVGELRQQLEEGRGEAERREEALSALTERTQTLERRVTSAALRYRELALERSPELPEELVSGATVEELDEAIARARETVSKVRGHLESQAQAGRVPVGAPPRSGPDLSSLSAEEKIRHGLEQRQR